MGPTDSSATVSHISIQNVGKGDLVVMGTTGSAPLDGDADGRRIGRGESIDNKALINLFPGVAAVQVWTGRVSHGRLWRKRRLDREYKIPKNSLTALSDIYIAADSDTNNTSVAGGFTLILVDD